MEDWALIRRLVADGVLRRQVARDLGVGRSRGRWSRTGRRGTSGQLCQRRSRRSRRSSRLPNELARLRRYGLIIVDEVGYLPFEQDAANLFFQLVSSRYEHASLILTSNLPFSGWGGVFGDQAVAAAMIDRVVHHADVLTLKGASYRLRNRGIDTLPSIKTQDTAD